MSLFKEGKLLQDETYIDMMLGTWFLSDRSLNVDKSKNKMLKTEYTAFKRTSVDEKDSLC